MVATSFNRILNLVPISGREGEREGERGEGGKEEERQRREGKRDREGSGIRRQTLARVAREAEGEMGKRGRNWDRLG